MTDMNNLTKSELEVMQVLWQSDEELSSSEIIAKSAEAGAHWQKSYIHLLINSLLDKGMIEIVGFIKNAKNYSRTFKAKLSKAEYITMRLGDECGYKDCIRVIASKLNSVPELDECIEILNNCKKSRGVKNG